MVERDSFGTRLGVLAAAAGSAIGLGNIWRFPYILGKNGGGAFLIIYLICIVIIGIPIMISEFIIGRSTKKNAIGAFKKLAPKTPWSIIGWMGLLSAIAVLSFYGVVAGWCMNYVVSTATNTFIGKTAQDMTNIFTSFTSSTWSPILWQLLFMFITGYIVVSGIKDGIEKYSKILMPVLLILIIILDIRALTLDRANEGLKFLFEPNFNQLTLNGVFIALGHAFFSLSIGMGTMLTYGSYINDSENLKSTALKVCIADTVIAILAGLAIFPAVFAYGIKPDTGAGLAFMSLPLVFQQMPLGNLFGALFFILLTVAALTSSISILEVIVAYFTEEYNFSRTKITIWGASFVSIIGIICSLSNGVLKKYTIFNMNFMDLMNYLSANILLPLGGLLISIFVGYYMDKKIIITQLYNNGTLSNKSISLFMFLVKIVSPIAIIFVFLKGIKII
ncbi:sodium-dependent transporter [Abyssisolibacter fermentans]|uniref:sodium-dependent transporter n=1 Tax=Abyssisolibacter fermentans TaxID=1766203 RepID=UPI0008362685|nr:sodium-dependent transporter [Abyssisolibacter fermentans]